MKYQSAAAFREALDVRIRTEAHRKGLPVDRLRRLVVCDRLLARLTFVTPGQWIVKGGIALELRYGHRARTTQDLDLALKEGAASVMDNLLAAQRLDIGDFFRFEIQPKQNPDRLNTEFAVRFHVHALVAGRTFSAFNIDVGAINPLEVATDYLPRIGLLAFAELEGAELQAVSLYRHVAEKLHAYTRIYATGHRSTRPKDLVDLVLIASLSPFDGDSLVVEIESAFRARKMQVVPLTLPLPPENWRLTYAQLASEIGFDTDLSVGYAAAAAFLDPVLRGEATNAIWDPTARQWREGTPAAET